MSLAFFLPKAMASELFCGVITDGPPLHSWIKVGENLTTLIVRTQERGVLRVRER
jgi:hypothetical protein